MRALASCCLVAIALSACESSREPERSPSTPPSPTVYPAVRVVQAKNATIEPVGDAREGSEIVLATVGGVRVAFVADEDERAIHTIHLDTRREIARTRLDGRPSRLLVLPGDRLAVALRDAGIVALLAADAAGRPLRPIAAIETADEPIALALPKTRDSLFVATGWGRTLESYALDDLHARSWRRLGREPRGLAVDDRGQVVVSYMSETHASVFDGRELAVPFESVTAMTASVGRQAFAVVRRGDKVMVPFARVTPGEPSVGGDGYGNAGCVAGKPLPPVSFAVATFDASSPATTLATTAAANETCLLPRGATAAFEGVGIACMGNDRVAVVDDTGKILRTLKVPGGPRAMAWDPAHEESVVLTEIDRTVVVVGAGDSVSQPIPLSHEPGLGLSAKAAEGRKLFHRATDTRISGDGRACASCHPDGRDDGMVWPTPEGPRQTLFLAGRLRRDLGFGWQAKHASIKEHVAKAITNLHGTGLPAGALEAIAAYCVAMSPPPRKERALTAEEAHGRDLFLSDRTGCATCHVDSTLFTDGAAHDVASGTVFDTSKTFLAPPLRFLSGTAPFFHDGRYASLGDLLRGTRNTMGSTASLTDVELDALEAYLRTL